MHTQARFSGVGLRCCIYMAWTLVTVYPHDSTTPRRGWTGTIFEFNEAALSSVL